MIIRNRRIPMKAAVFSDTHSNTALMVEAVRRCRPDVIIHLGDYERDTEILRREFPQIPLYNVCGNCDMMPAAPLADIVPLGPVKAYICHGHSFGADYGDMSSLVYAAQEAGAKIAMFGHTHRPYLESDGEVTLLNPGSLSYPRQEGRRPSYIVMELDKEGEAHFTIKYL